MSNITTHYTAENPIQVLKDIHNKRSTAQRLQQALTRTEAPKDLDTCCEDIALFEESHLIHKAEFEELSQRLLGKIDLSHQSLILIGHKDSEAYRRNGDGSYQWTHLGGDFRESLGLDIFNCHVAKRLPILLLAERTLQTDVEKAIAEIDAYMQRPEQQRFIQNPYGNL